MVTVRLATQNDIPSMRDLISQSVERGEVLPRTLQELTDLLPTFFVAESTENRIVGTAALEVYSRNSLSYVACASFPMPKAKE